MNKKIAKVVIITLILVGIVGVTVLASGNRGGGQIMSMSVEQETEK